MLADSQIDDSRRNVEGVRLFRDVDPALSWLREQVIAAAAELPPCP